MQAKKEVEQQKEKLEETKKEIESLKEKNEALAKESLVKIGSLIDSIIEDAQDGKINQSKSLQKIIIA